MLKNDFVKKEERLIKMLNFFTINPYPQPVFVDDIQVIKNEDGILEMNTIKKRKRVKEGTEENVFNVKDMKKISLNKYSFQNLSILGSHNVTGFIYFENDKKENLSVNVDIPIAVIVDWNSIYGIIEIKDEYLLNLPSDMSELYLMEYSGRNMSNIFNIFPVSNKFKAVSNILEIKNTDSTCSRDYVYCKNGRVFFFVEKVKYPCFSITLTKDKKQKTLSWKNKYKEAYLFIDMYGNKKIVNSVEAIKKEFSRKIAKKDFDKFVKDDKLKDFGIHPHYLKIPFDEMYKEALNKTTKKEKLSIYPNQLKNEVFQVLKQFKNPYEIINELVNNHTISVNSDNKDEIYLLSKIQRCLSKVITSNDFGNIEEIFKKINIKFENFKFDMKDIKSTHCYQYLGPGNPNYNVYMDSKFILLGEYYFKSFDINEHNLEIDIKANDKYEKKIILIQSSLIQSSGIKKLIDAINGESNSFYLDSVIYCPVKKVFPIYDEGSIKKDKCSDKEFNKFIEEFPSYFSRTSILKLSKLISRKDFKVTMKSNDNLSILSPNYFLIQKVVDLFSAIGCKEEDDMIKMLDTFSNFHLLLKLLEEQL